MAEIDPTKAKVHVTYAHAATFYSLCADPAGTRLYAGSEDYAIHVFDRGVEKKEPIARWTRHDNYVSALAFLAHGSKPLLVSGSYDRQLLWWDVATGEPVRSVEAHAGWIRDVVATPDHARLVSVGDDMLVKVWEADTGKLIHTLKGHAAQTPQGHVTALYTVAVSPDGKYAASGDRIGSVRVWDLASGEQVQSLEVPILYTYDPKQRKRSIGGIRSVAFSPDGTLLAIGGVGQIQNVDGLGGPAHIEVWDWRQPARRFAAGAEGHKGLVNHLLFHPEAPWLIGGGGGGDNGFLAFWKLDALPVGAAEKQDAVAGQRAKADGHYHRLALGPMGQELYAAGYRKLDVWNLT
jgi:WD40 repeat protein